MSYRLLAVLVASGCATAGGSEQPPDGQLGGTDASTGADATMQPDAAMQIDAAIGCTQQTVNLLTNGAFEQVAAGWTETRHQPNDAIIRNDGITGHTPPYVAWLGGSLGNPAIDSIHQDIAIPASTTAMTLTGFFQVDTEEFIGTYDRARVEIMDTNNASLAIIRNLDNNTLTAGWTALSYTFTNLYAGQTIRLRLTSNGDNSNRTHFFFDSLALSATVCQ